MYALTSPVNSSVLKYAEIIPLPIAEALIVSVQALGFLEPSWPHFILPECLSSLHKRSFIASCLYEFV